MAQVPLEPHATPNTDDSLRHTLTQLATETTGADRPDLDLLPSLALVQQMNHDDAQVPVAVAKQAPQIAAAIDGIVERMRRGGRLFYLGAGTPGRLGILDASECPPTFGIDPGLVIGLIAGGTAAIQSAVEDAEDDAEAAPATLADHALTAADTVVGISASGRTPYVIGGLRYAASIGALTISIASNPDSPIAALADIPIDVVVGPEFISGSTRLKSGTAQKLVLNMLSTITMIKLGKTYHGMMVDLRATNQKLKQRSQLTVMHATGVDAEAARQALDAANDSVKTAIFMIITGLGRDLASAALDAADGILRVALLAAPAPSKETHPTR
ncbi:N-acetylmuramic acid 6-phosphate etherase [Glaciibacter psychrotolerans]|uniref:N-acetylmuramic acid 6-phosphate etherase n=1 Tax=Glaciibacter psychrotolerans TaxID=670054 RepID=A0A7Z0EAY6_9MICO|nr:N-acetylmuramic acid 6-phosphate etherase [Leifsonia psychrotolerans]NYJ18318.1 N-acetylmuramic acid 6-phosphate etherase [Leifsonia psychrotolerans]